MTQTKRNRPMTYQVEDSALDRGFELLAEEGFDGMS